MKDYIFFDLDGTLTDSQEGIINSLKLALNYFNISKTENELRSFIGPSLQNTFQKSLGMNQEDYETAVKIFREYFSTKGLFENKVYEGIPNLLEQLKKSNRHNVVATSKPEKFAKQILEHFKLDAFLTVFVEVVWMKLVQTRQKLLPIQWNVVILKKKILLEF